MGFEGRGGGVRVYELAAGGDLVALDNYFLVAGATSFCCDDCSIIGFRNFVDDSYETFMPSVFVIFFRTLCSIPDICKAGLGVGYSWEVEGELELWGEDIDLAERLDASCAFEGLGGEIRAICKV